MDLVLDTTFFYRGFCGNEAECRLRVYEKPGQAIIVVASELASNRGSSIVSMVTKLAERVWRILEQPHNGMIWIEHIPYISYTAPGEDFTEYDTFSRVVFADPLAGLGGSLERRAEIFANPFWIQLNKKEVDGLLLAN